MTEQPNEPVTVPANEQVEKTKPRRGIIIIIIVLAALLILLCCCLVVAAAIIGLDPFNLHLIERVMGTYDPITGTLPADTDLYVQVDLLKLDSEETANILNAFLDASESDMQNKDDLIERLDEEMEEETGLTFTGDIKPWLGQHIGVAYLDLEVDIWGEPTDESLLVIFETIDTDLADTYILGLINSYQEDGWVFEDQDYGGVTIFESKDNDMAIARRNELIYFSSSADTIQEVLDVTKEDALSKDPAYREAMAALPGDRLLTLYVGDDFFEAVETIMEDAAEMEIEQPMYDTFTTYRNLSMALTLVEQGIQIDTVTNLDPSQISQDQLDLMNTRLDSREMAAYFPEDTYVFIAGKRLDLVWKSYREQMMLDPLGADVFNAGIEDIEYEFGLNVDTELFPYLDGNWALGLYHTNQGLMVQDPDIPMGMMLMLGSSNISELQNSTEKIADTLTSDQFYDVEEVSEQGIVLYEVTDPWYEEESMFVFGTGNSYLFFGSDINTIQKAFDSGSSLGTTAHFNEVWAPFGEDMIPALYLDISGILDWYESSDPMEDAGALKPLETVAVASSPVVEGQMHSQILFFINTD